MTSVAAVCRYYYLYFIFFDIITSLHANLHENIHKSSNLMTRLRRKREIADNNFGTTYLTNYGYAAPGALHSGGRVAELRSMRDAILDMQAFFLLEETGVFDESTMRLMKKPRCANPDKISIVSNLKRKKRYVKVGSRWQTPQVTYSINNVTPKLGKKLTHEAIDAAFETWGKHIPLEFKKVSQKDNPDIVTFFAEGYHNDNTAFDGQGGFLAHAYYPGTGIGGDTHFDASEPWTLHEKPYTGNDLFLVAVHELGHALGLGHSQNQEAIMAPVYRHHDTDSFELPRDDIYGIQSIYGARYSKPYNPIVPTTTLQHGVSPTPLNPSRPRTPGRPRAVPTTRTRPTTTTTRTPLPNICKLSNYDAVSFLRRELYVFKDNYMWRRQTHDTTMQGPYKITSFWAQLEDGVNAVYENPVTKRIIFFKDHMYWEYDGITLARPSPRSVRFLGLQNQHVGAAVWWEMSGKSYFFQGSSYWRFSETRVEHGYPKPIDVWNGVPGAVDAAFTEVDQKKFNFTYFVKGTEYWTFSNDELKVIGPPKSFKKDWLRCGQTDPKIDKLNPAGSASGVPKVVVPIVVLLLVLILTLTYVVRKRRNVLYEKPVIASTTITKPPRPPPYTPSGLQPSISTKYQAPQKTMLVSTAQQKLRWCKFSLQGQV